MNTEFPRGKESDGVGVGHRSRESESGVGCQELSRTTPKSRFCLLPGRYFWLLATLYLSADIVPGPILCPFFQVVLYLCRVSFYLLVSGTLCLLWSSPALSSLKSIKSFIEGSASPTSNSPSNHSHSANLPPHVPHCNHPPVAPLLQEAAPPSLQPIYTSPNAGPVGLDLNLRLHGFNTTANQGPAISSYPQAAPLSGYSAPTYTHSSSVAPGLQFYSGSTPRPQYPTSGLMPAIIPTCPMQPTAPVHTIGQTCSCQTSAKPAPVSQTFQPPKTHPLMAKTTSAAPTTVLARTNNSQEPNAVTRKSGPTRVTSDSESVCLPSGRYWSFWPDGEWAMDLTGADTEDPHTKKLMVHWPCTAYGTPKGHKGSVDADTWEQGAVKRRRCNGIISCTTPKCPYTLRPLADTIRTIQNQASSTPCLNCKKCTLKHEPCGVMLRIYKYKHGAHVMNSGFHTHPRIPRLLHLTPDEETQIHTVIEEHPMAGPSELVTGRRGLSGPRDSVAVISSVLENPQRVAYEKQKLKNSLKMPFERAWTEFQNKYPGFILDDFTKLGPDISVIICQSAFMRSHLVQELEGGIVTDAAHGFWADRNSVLITSSVYSEDLSHWIPVIITWANGTTAEHYKHHFSALFHTMDIELTQRNMHVTDDMFANNTAKLLLKGCQQHFCASVERVRRIGCVVKSNPQRFEERTKSLIHIHDGEEFRKVVQAITDKFPDTTEWLLWWLHPDRAAMLFRKDTKMPEEIWDWLQDTTNAQEAMHHKMYAHIGKDHELISGFQSLRAFIAREEHQAHARASGILTEYQPTQRSLKNQAKHGHSKPDRAPTAHQHYDRSDYAPPDTAAQLHKSSQKDWVQKALDRLATGFAGNTISVSLQKKVHLAAHPPSQTNEHRQSSFPWFDNSCWLDTMLELISCATFWDYWASFYPRFQALDSTHPLHTLGRVIHQRVTMDTTTLSIEGQIEILRLLQDGFRRDLGWLGTPSHACVSLQKEHWQFASVPQTSFYYQLTRPLASRYNGLVTEWFKTKFSRPSKDQRSQCWCQPLGDSGSDIHMVFIIEVDETIASRSEYPGSPEWDIPDILRPLTLAKEKSHQLVYRLVGRAFYDAETSHFSARGVTSDRQHIYSYDGKDKGHAYVIARSSVGSHLAGTHKNLGLPPSVSTSLVLYHLEGGTEAQRHFTRHQLAELQKTYSIVPLVPTSSLTAGQESIPRALHMVDEHLLPVDNSSIFWSKLGKNLEYYKFQRPSGQPATPSNKPVSPVEPPFTKWTAAAAFVEMVIFFESPNGLFSVTLAKTGRILPVSTMDRQVIWGHGPNLNVIRAVRPLSESSWGLNLKGRFVLSVPSKFWQLASSKGGLARFGKFWYPVRIVDTENLLGKAYFFVKWWRGNHYTSPRSPQDLARPVLLDDLVDALWNDAKARRQIKLGKWQHSWESAMSASIEETLASFTSPISCPSVAIASALLPHLGMLTNMVNRLEYPEHFPHSLAAQYSAKNPQERPPVFGGLLTASDAAQIARWILLNVPGSASGIAWPWHNHWPHSHASAIVYATRLAGTIPSNAEIVETQDILTVAWEHLLKARLQGVEAQLRQVDVDWECLHLLEQRMFTDSPEAGVAGNEQWGWDIGRHQDNWSPYAGVPSHWKEYRVEHEDELEVGSQFSGTPDDTVPTAIAGEVTECPPLPRKHIPKPRRKKRKPEESQSEAVPAGPGSAKRLRSGARLVGIDKASRSPTVPQRRPCSSIVVAAQAMPDFGGINAATQAPTSDMSTL
ncbi:hypothetical protein CONPUDRAFT_72328 [Coniophora puteana RWD-64-598 SS2]|uniref:Uncharacterized protein n=1 Tax=Coniophora puteana (strain RWD-64-598) TaxID=741705 RepID=A0A5M3MSB0_CONPW|nr:uncharacterized protein CONPUDRAFT_72328 [Coniophora puteana RWD-64-598 SS2]EIW81980.1 hypothetical protein CONPUDRAFT_72328 [Coniophora puteana RWD-64-598 SS2]